MKINNKICFSVFTASCLIAIATCAICGLAILNSFAWSLIAISSIVFGWAILSPIMLYPRKGFYISSIVLSLLIIPFLYILSILLDVKEVFSIGWVMAIIGIIFLWGVIGICCKLRRRPYLAAGFSVLLSAPICLVTNLTLAKMLPQTANDTHGNVTSVILLLVISAALFLAQYLKGGKTQKK